MGGGGTHGNWSIVPVQKFSSLWLVTDFMFVCVYVCVLVCVCILTTPKLLFECRCDTRCRCFHSWRIFDLSSHV